MNTNEQNLNKSIVPPEICRSKDYYDWEKEMVESGRASKGYIYAMSTLDLQEKWNDSQMSLNDFSNMIEEHCTDMSSDEKEAVIERSKIILK